MFFIFFKNVLFLENWNIEYISIMDKIFPGFKDAFQKVKDWLYETFIKPISEWFGKLFSFDKNDKATASIIAETQSSVAPNNGKNTTTTDLGVQKRLSGGGSSNGVSGGTNIKHVTIHVRSIVENFSVITDNIKEGANKAKDIVLEGLMTSLNDVNYSN